jgi:hypothetical protein
MSQNAISFPFSCCGKRAVFAHRGVEFRKLTWSRGRRSSSMGSAVYLHRKEYWRAATARLAVISTRC